MRLFRFLLLPAMIVGSCHSQPTENNIVLINTGPYNKGTIAKLISKVNALNPKVISLDIAFPYYDGSNDDISLSMALDKCNNLVMATTVESDEGGVYFALTSSGEFTPVRKKTGFVSAKVEEAQIKIPKQFIVQQKDFDGYTEYHFSVQTAMSFDSLATAIFIDNNPQTADVDYKNGNRKFKTFSTSDVLNGSLTNKDVEGKIVMVGFLGPGDTDKFYTPLGTRPEMYGVEYLANIVAQVLESK